MRASRAWSSQASLIALAFICFFEILQREVFGLGLLEPANGNVYLAAWTDSSHPYHDSPSSFNRRIGHNAYAFQYTQTIPISPWNSLTGSGGPINFTHISQTSTSAALFLTVYPVALSKVHDEDLISLAQQILQYQATRPVFLRFAPEMQGSWMTYGAQPEKFLSVWRRMFDIVKAIAPKTVIVWAPNSAMGYPYSIKMEDILSTTDRALLDTNRNGQLDAGDDAYGPYFPGDQYVDWNGISWYWKGTRYPYRLNQIQPKGYASGAMSGLAPEGAIGNGTSQSFTKFYDTYCREKPCMFSEMGAAFHTNCASKSGATQQKLQEAWWKDTLTSIGFMDAYPKLKMFMLFEHEKFEDAGDKRDYRLTVNEKIRRSWLSDMEAVKSRYIWADAYSVTSISRGKTFRDFLLVKLLMAILLLSLGLNFF